MARHSSGSWRLSHSEAMPWIQSIHHCSLLACSAMHEGACGCMCLCHYPFCFKLLLTCPVCIGIHRWDPTSSLDAREPEDCGQHLMLMLYWDPFQPFRDDHKYSCTPFLVTTANAPAEHRWEPGLSHLVTMTPGSRDGGVDPNPTLELITDELMYLRYKGVQVQDASRGGHKCTVKAALLFGRSDYRGWEDIVGDAMTGAPARVGACYRCWHSGKSFPNYKTVYQTHA